MGLLNARRNYLGNNLTQENISYCYDILRLKITTYFHLILCCYCARYKFNSVNMVNATLIVFMIVTIVLLFSAMVLSAMASSDATKGASECKEGCREYSKWSALVTGIAVAVIVVVLVVYIYSTRKHIAAAAQQHVAALHGVLGGVAGRRARTPVGSVPMETFE